MWPSESDLESLDSIIDRMNPMPGFPYPMKSAKNEGFPRSCGDPWIGAYTKNGYWFKLTWNGENEWDEVANEMWYRNEMLVDSKSFGIFRNCYEDEKDGRLKLLCAKNIRGDVLGLALLSKNSRDNFSVVGPVFVQEDFRHIGIGSILMKETMQSGKDVAFNAISYLIPTVPRFALTPKSMRTFGRIRVKKPSGFASLKEEKSGLSILLESRDRKISSDDWEKIADFGEKCTNERRNWRVFEDNNENSQEKRSQLVAAFEETSCVGICVLRELHNEDNEIPDLLIAPLYAKNQAIAEILLRKSLLKHYNPEDDYDFDVDHHAIYRRSVNFFVFSNCESTMFPLLKKLAGSDGKMEKDRLTYQTCSNFQLPAICHDMIFAMGDPNVFLA